MDDREFEGLLRRVLEQDFSAGTEEFREALLARCLEELDADGRSADLEDDELELLAAAGDPHAAADAPANDMPMRG